MKKATILATIITLIFLFSNTQDYVKASEVEYPPGNIIITDLLK